MAFDIVRYIQYVPTSPRDFVAEVNDRWLVTVGSDGNWAAFDTQTNTAQAFVSGIPGTTGSSGENRRFTAVVAYGDYAWAAALGGIYRLNPRNGGIRKMTTATNIVLYNPNHVLVGSNLWLFPSDPDNLNPSAVRRYNLATNTFTTEWPTQLFYYGQHTLYAFGSLWNRTGAVTGTTQILQRRNLTNGEVLAQANVEGSGAEFGSGPIIAHNGYLWWGSGLSIAQFDPESMELVDTYHSGGYWTYRDRLVVGSDGRLYSLLSDNPVYLRAFDPTTKRFSELTDPLLRYQDILFVRPSDGKMWAISGSTGART